MMLVDRIAAESTGAERLVVGLAASLPRERFEVSVCTTRSARGPLVAELTRADVACIDLRRRFRLDVLPLARLARILRRERCDVLHAHMFGSNVWGSLIGRLCDVPVVIAHEHSWSYEGKPWRRLIDGRLIAPLATRFVAASESDRERMVTHEGVPRAKTVVMPNAYIPRSNGTPAELRIELGLPETTPLIGTIAGLRKPKALDLLLEAHALVVRDHPAAALVLVGQGPCRRALERRAAELGTAEAVHFLGIREDVGGILDSLDVGAISSDTEGTPLFAIECMAHGVPLVTTAVGGLPDLAAGGAALLVPRRNPVALAAAISRLLVDSAARAALARTALLRAQTLHIEQVAGRYGDLYERLLLERKGAAA
jgi:glycosyltransferase involved in cell wall biosynthesis